MKIFGLSITSIIILVLVFFAGFKYSKMRG